MTGVLVEDHVFALDNSELDPVYNFVPPSSPLSCADHGFKGMFSTPFSQEGITLSGFKSGNQGSMTISPLQGMDYVGNAAEKGIGGIGFMGKLSALTAEKGNGGMGSVGKSPSFAAEKGNGGMDYVGGKLALHAAQKKGSNDELVCRSISGMGVMDGDGQGYVGNARDDVGDVNQGYVGDVQGYVGDLQASMAVVGDSLQRFLPPNNEDYTMDFFSCDEFRMYDFKVRRCMRGRSHDWTECPFAHPGEKARRRDPRRFHYSGTACPDFRKGNCNRGDSCELSHGVFECWLHPARYRTQLCKDGKACKRRVCFFAHSPSQLRLVSPDAVAPSPNNGFSLKSATASSIDGFPSYPDVSFNRPPSIAHNGSPLRLASIAGYHADGFFDGFSTKNSHGLLSDEFFDGFSPNACHSHSHRHGLPIDGFFDGFIPENSIGHDDGLFNGFISNNTHSHSHSHVLPIDGLLVDEYGPQDSHGHNYTHTHCLPRDGLRSDGFYDGFSSKKNHAYINLMNKLTLAGLTNNLHQILSPTSTLIGHSISPPPLSPPLSPPESPPRSPNTVSSSWSNALARKIASLSGQPASFDVISNTEAPVADLAENNGAPASISQFQASLLANSVQRNGGAMLASAHGPSRLSSNNLGCRRHQFERLNSMPEVLRHQFERLNSMPEVPPSHFKDQSLQTAPKEAHSAQAHLISTLQQMELRSVVVDMKNKMKSAHLSRSVPNFPNSRWTSQGEAWDVDGAMGEPPVQRVESGRGLRAKIYGNLGKEAGFEKENPDLGWVNELVK